MSRAAHCCFCQAFTLYEDEVSDSRDQVSVMSLVVGTLQRITCFTEENYTPLITKCVACVDLSVSVCVCVCLCVSVCMCVCVRVCVGRTSPQ